MGLLDAAIYNAVTDREIKLWRANTVIGPNSMKNPLCIVANYLFDTLYHDIFQVNGSGELFEGLISTGSNSLDDHKDPLNPDIITRFNNKYLYKPIKEEEYYREEEGDEEHLARVLQWYKNYYSRLNDSNAGAGASVLLPIGALRAIRRLSLMSNNRVLVISGDKGNNNPDQFIGQVDPHFATHGSFSFMVNYHAIGAYFTSRNGFALHNLQDEASLKVSCFLLLGSDGDSGVPVDPLLTTTCAEDLYGPLLNKRDVARAEKYIHLSQAFVDFVGTFGPNDFFMIQKGIKEDLPNPSMGTILALLKMSDWDTDVFYKFRDQILNQLPSSGMKLKNDILAGLPRLWKHYFLLDTEKDIAFELGRVYYGLREFESALSYYQISTNTIGKHQVTFHNQGLCYYSLGKLPEALENFQLAVAMSEHYEKARNWAEKVVRELAARDTYSESIAAAAAANPPQEGQGEGQGSVNPIINPHTAASVGEGGVLHIDCTN